MSSKGSKGLVIVIALPIMAMGAEQIISGLNSYGDRAILQTIFGIIVFTLALLAIRGARKLASTLEAMTYERYVAENPKDPITGKVICNCCGGKRINVKQLRPHSSHREHFWLYAVPSGT